MPILRKNLNEALKVRDGIISRGHEHHKRAVDFAIIERSMLPRKVKQAFARRGRSAVLASKHEWAKLPAAREVVRIEAQKRKEPLVGFKRKVVATSDVLDRREGLNGRNPSTGKRRSLWNDLRRIWGAGKK